MFTGAYKKKRMANMAISNPIVATQDELKTPELRIHKKEEIEGSSPRKLVKERAKKEEIEGSTPRKLLK
jgi:hypothetical protein